MNGALFVTPQHVLIFQEKSRSGQHLKRAGIGQLEQSVAGAVPAAHRRNNHRSVENGSHWHSNSTPRNLQKPDQRLNPQLKIPQVEFLVGRVQIIVGQSKAHHYAGQVQVARKVAHNRN